MSHHLYTSFSLWSSFSEGMTHSLTRVSRWPTQWYIHWATLADDLALIEYGDVKGIANSTSRVSSISEGSEKDADMTLSIPKTKVMHVRRQDAVSTMTQQEAKDACKYVCSNEGCDHCFLNLRGLKIHEARCKFRDHFEVDRILGCKGPVTSRSYLIKWTGYDPSHNTWEPRSNIKPEMIKAYEVEQGEYVHSWPHRCDVCDLPCASERGIKIHKSKAHKAPEPQNFTGRLVVGKVKVAKLKVQQASRPSVKCVNTPLENVFCFKYLGSTFSADGDTTHDIEARIAMAQKRWSSLRHIFNSPHLSIDIKLRLYSASVCSLIAFGSESWRFTKKVMKRLNGANSRMLSSFTGKTVQQEARPASTSLNLVLRLRKTRLR